MKRKINWKFAFVLVLGVVICVAMLFGLKNWRRNHISQEGLRLGNDAYQKHQWKEAAHHLGRYIARHPQDIPMLLKYADAQLNIRPIKRGNVQQALSAYRNVLRIDKQNDEAADTLVQLYLNINEPVEAAFIAKEFLEQKDNSRRRCLLAMALIEQRQFNEAAKELKKMIQEKPDEILAYEIYGQLVEQQPQLFPDDQPEIICRQAVQNNPNSVHALLFRAEYYLKQNEKSKAIEDIRQADELHTTDSKLLVRLAKNLIYIDDGEKAKTILTQLQKTMPDDLALWQVWAALAQSHRNKDLMKQVADDALENLGEKRWDFMTNAVELMILSDQSERAKQLISEMQQQEISQPVLFYYQGLIAQKENQPYRVIQFWRKAIERGYAPVQLRLMLANALNQTGESYDAVQQLRSVIAEQPDNADALIMLSRLMLKVGNTNDAFEQAKKARRLSPRRLDAVIAYVQAALQFYQNQKMNPDSPELKELKSDLENLAKNTDQRFDVMILNYQWALQQNDFAGAERCLTELKKQQPASLQAAMAEVHLLKAQNKSEPAWVRLREIVEQFDYDAVPVKALAMMLLDSNPADAENLLAKAMELNPQSEIKKEIGILLATIYQQQGQENRAYELLNQLAQTLPDDIQLKRQLLKLPVVNTDKDQAQHLVDQIKTLEGESGWQWRLEQARLWLSQAGDNQQKILEQYNPIVSILTENLRLNPANLDSRILLAHIHKLAGKQSLAIEEFQEAYQDDPSNISVIIPLVAALNQAGEYDHANEIIQKAAQQHLSDPGLTYYQLRHYLAAGQVESGMALIEDVLKDDPENQKYMLMLAVLKAEKGQLDEADKLIKVLWDRYPDSLPVASAFIDLKMKMNQSDHALEMCNQLVEKQNNADVYLMRARVNAYLGRLEQAEADFTKAITLDPDNGQAWILLVEFYNTHDKKDDASRIMQNALDQQPENLNFVKYALPLFLDAQDKTVNEKGQALLENTLKKYPQDPELLLFNARQLMRVPSSANIEKAIHDLKIITVIKPQLPQAWVLGANIAFKNKNSQKALELVQKGLAASPNNKELLLLRAGIEKEQSPFLALATLKSLSELFPSDLNVCLQLADTYILNQEPDKAVRCLQKYQTDQNQQQLKTLQIALQAARYKQGEKQDAIQNLQDLYDKESDDPHPLLTIARLMIDSRDWDQLKTKTILWIDKDDTQNDWPNAVAAELAASSDPDARQLADTLLRRLTEKNDANATAWLLLANVALQEDRLDDAEDIYKKILQKNPNHAIACNNLAWLLSEKRGQQQQAMNLIEAGLKNAPPDYLDIYDTRGMIFYRIGEYQKALQDFEKCINTYPLWSSSLTGAYYHHAMALMQLDQKTDAVDSLKKTLELQNRIGGLPNDDLKKAKQSLNELTQGVK